MKLKKSILKYVFPKALIEVRHALIRLEIELPPEDLITAIFVLTYDTELEVSRAARKAFTALPENMIMKALAKKLVPEVVNYIVENFPLSERVLDMLALNENISDDTLVRLAGTCNLETLEIFVLSARILKIPQILQALKSNPNATGEVINSAEQNIIAMGGSIVVKTEVPETLIDESDSMKEEEKALNLFMLVQSLSVGEKVKLALTGNKEARGLLLKQSNKVISRSVVRNPRITDDEIIKVTHSRSASDEILREIARNDHWLKNYGIRKGLIFNPKTPIQVSLRLLSKINQKDLLALSKSKGVPNVITAAAERLAAKVKV